MVDTGGADDVAVGDDVRTQNANEEDMARLRVAALVVVVVVANAVVVEVRKAGWKRILTCARVGL
jgi:hypothetical protein